MVPSFNWPPHSTGSGKFDEAYRGPLDAIFSFCSPSTSMDSMLSPQSSSVKVGGSPEDEERRLRRKMAKAAFCMWSMTGGRHATEFFSCQNLLNCLDLIISQQRKYKNLISQNNLRSKMAGIGVTCDWRLSICQLSQISLLFSNKSSASVALL